MKKLILCFLLMIFLITVAVSCGVAPTTTEAPDTTAVADGTTTDAPVTTEAPDSDQTYSQGLCYRLSAFQDSYVVVGMGDCTDADLVIPPVHDGMPVTEIEDDAHLGGKQVRSITIPDSVTVIGYRAFTSGPELESITVGKNNSVCYVEGNCLIAKESKALLLGCKNSVIPSDVTLICEFAFENAVGLTEITVPEGVTEIETAAFRGCSTLAKVVISNGVTRIGEQAFAECTALATVTLPDSLEGIGVSAFFGCTSLTGVYITDLAAWCNIEFIDGPSNPLRYAHKLYLDGEAVTDLVIPEGVETVGTCAFIGFTDLVSVTLPNSLKAIGPSAFYDCENLTAVQIPDNVTEISGSAFYRCKSLQSVTLGKDLVRIGRTAFYHCTSLSEILIPEGVTKLDEDAFYDCNQLSIYCEVREKPAGWHEKWNSSDRPVVWNCDVD